jgi:hypothetical protein
LLGKSFSQAELKVDKAYKTILLWHIDKEAKLDQIFHGREVAFLTEEKVLSNSFIKGGWYE